MRFAAIKLDVPLKAKVYLCGPTRHSKNSHHFSRRPVILSCRRCFDETDPDPFWRSQGGIRDWRAEHSPVFFGARNFQVGSWRRFFWGVGPPTFNRNGLLDPLLLKFQTCLFWAYGTIIPSLYFCRLLWSYYNKNLWNWPQERIYQKLQEEACQSQYAHALIVGYLNKLLAPHASQDGRILVTL